MGYFDFLIDKENKNPKEGLEYIYYHNMVWKPNSLGSHPIEKGTIVTNVVKLENNSYEFNIGGKEGKWRTNYGWSLLENTPENVKLIEEYKDEYRKLKLQEEKSEKVWKQIKKLK